MLQSFGGGDPDSAVPLALNALTTGTTAGYTNVSDEVCPYTGSTAPDVYYVYTPATSHDLTVEHCESGFDTKTYVYDSLLNLVVNINEVPACNDDACSSSGGGSFRSLLNWVPVAAGAAYYVVVDGFGDEAGPYSVTLHDTVEFTGDPDACPDTACIFGPCEPGNSLEGETCDDSVVDDCFNGGCNCKGGDELAAFSTISADETVCGQGWYNGKTRDTDWYRYDVTPFYGGSCIWSVIVEFEAVIGRVENGGVHDCTNVVAFAEVAVGNEVCDELSITTSFLCPGATYWFFVGTNFTTTILCGDELPGNDYVATLNCEIPLPFGECPSTCPWDVSGNFQVDFADLLEVLANWGPCS